MSIRHFLDSLLLLICLCISSLPIWPAQISFASTKPSVSTHVRQTSLAATSSAHVTIIVQDMSGSMSQNDPTMIRCSATNAYIDLSNPGDIIGVVQLNSGNGGPSSPLLPLTRVTASNKGDLQQELAQNNHHCQPDGSTPTYAALQEALKMLNDSMNIGLSGSVILLTDGLPDGGNTEIAHIEHDLIPQFKGRWPIDTIALGEAANSNFLTTIANDTAGIPYKDTDGEVPGVSALNVMPFFVQIFAEHDHENLVRTISGQTLPYASSFIVGAYADHYDLIVMKEDASATIGLTDPHGGVISATTIGSGQFYSSGDPHYLIYETTSPPQGTWQINARGSGRMLAYSLIIPSLTATIISPTPGTVLPFDKSLMVKVAMTSHGSAVPGTGYDLRGQWLRNNGQVIGEFDLLENPDTNQFINTDVSLDGSSTIQPGTYTLQIQVRGTGGGDPIITSSQIYTFDYLTMAALLETNGLVARGVAQQSVERWPAAIQFIYTHLTTIPWLTPFGHLALQGPSLFPLARFAGEVLEDGQLYTGKVQITASATRMGYQDVLTVPIVSDPRRPGYFFADFSQMPEGRYVVKLVSYGRLGGTTDSLTSVQQVQLIVLPVSTGAQVLAFSLTAVYLVLWLLIVFHLILLLFYPFIRVRTLKYLVEPDGTPRPVNNRMSLWKRLYHPKRVFFKPELQDKGLELRVRGSNIEVRQPRRKSPKQHWFTLDQSPVNDQFKGGQRVIYSFNSQPTDPQQAKIYRLYVQTKDDPSRRSQKVSPSQQLGSQSLLDTQNFRSTRPSAYTRPGQSGPVRKTSSGKNQKSSTRKYPL